MEFDSRLDRYPKLVKGEPKVVWEWQGRKGISIAATIIIIVVAVITIIIVILLSRSLAVGFLALCSYVFLHPDFAVYLWQVVAFYIKN